MDVNIIEARLTTELAGQLSDRPLGLPIYGTSRNIAPHLRKISQDDPSPIGIFTPIHHSPSKKPSKGLQLNRQISNEYMSSNFGMQQPILPPIMFTSSPKKKEEKTFKTNLEKQNKLLERMIDTMTSKQNTEIHDYQFQLNENIRQLELKHKVMEMELEKRRRELVEQDEYQSKKERKKENSKTNIQQLLYLALTKELFDGDDEYQSKKGSKSARYSSSFDGTNAMNSNQYLQNSYLPPINSSSYLRGYPTGVQHKDSTFRKKKKSAQVEFDLPSEEYSDEEVKFSEKQNKKNKKPAKSPRKKSSEEENQNNSKSNPPLQSNYLSPNLVDPKKEKEKKVKDEKS